MDVYTKVTPRRVFLELMMLNRAAPVAALLLAAAGIHFSEAADPSEGWLSYTVFKAQPTQISETRPRSAGNSRSCSRARLHSRRLPVANTTCTSSLQLRA